MDRVGPMRPHVGADAPEPQDMAQGSLRSVSRNTHGLEPVGPDLAVQRPSIDAENMRGLYLMPVGFLQNPGNVLSFQFLQRRLMRVCCR